MPCEESGCVSSVLYLYGNFLCVCGCVCSLLLLAEGATEVSLTS